MQTNLSDIKQLLTDWYLLTLDNPLYTGTLVLSTGLLAVFIYSIKLFLLKKKQRLAEQANAKLQNQLDEAQKDKAQSEEKLTAIHEELAREQKVSTELTQKVAERNQKIVENIKQLASQFNLSEQLVTSDAKPKTDFVWQQQDNIQLQLIERLQAERQEKDTLQKAYNQEKDQFSQQNAQTAQLQKTLDLQISKSAQLEQDLNVQKHLQQQLRNESEKILADKLADLQAKHDLAESLNVEQKIAKETIAVVPEAQINDPAETLNDELSQVAVEPIVPVVSSLEGQEFLNIEQTEPDVAVNKHNTEITEPSVIEEVQDQVDFEPDYTKSNLNIANKFKGLLSKSKKSAVKQEEVMHQKPVVTTPEENVPHIEEEAGNDTKSSIDLSGKFKKLFSKDAKQTKNLDQVELASETEESLADKSPENDQVKKFKNPFGKDKQQVDPVIPEQHEESVRVEEDDPEEQVYEPDYEQSNFHMPVKIKKLFGKK